MSNQRDVVQSPHHGSENQLDGQLSQGSAHMSGRQLRVCYFGTYRAGYSRNQVMIEGLRQNGVEVMECHEPLWRGIDDRVQKASGGWVHPRFIARVVRAYWRLVRAHHKIDNYDVMVLGYPGQLDAYLARLLTWLRRKPLVLDVFMSLYLIAWERGLTARHHITGRLIFWLEKGALLLPELLIQDTGEYVNWLQGTFGIDSAHFELVPTGADDRWFHPVPRETSVDGVFRVLYYGTFIPNHGVEHIVEAARLLSNETDILFELIGQGPEKENVMNLVQDYGLTNVSTTGWLDKDELIQRIMAADICLGAFGTTPQSQMTIQNKIYEGLAMARPVLTGDSDSVRQSLVHGTHVYLCQRAHPQSLAEAICILKGDPGLRHQLATEGYNLYRAQFSLQRNGARYAAHLRNLVTSVEKEGTNPMYASSNHRSPWE